MEPMNEVSDVPLLPDATTPQKEAKVKAPLFASMVNVANCIVGAGILTLPHAVANCGLALGWIVLLTFASVSIASMILLKHCFTESREITYADVARFYFGTKLSIVVQMCQLFYSISACCGYAIIISNQLANIVSLIDLPDKYHFIGDRRFLISVAMILLVLPPALLKSFKALSYTSSFGMLLVLYLTIVVIIQAPWSTPCKLAMDAHYTCNSDNMCVLEPKHLNTDNYMNYTECRNKCETSLPENLSFKYFIFGVQIFASIPLFCFGFCCQVQFIPILSEMANPTNTNVYKMIAGALSYVLLLYLPNSLGGYLSFCRETLGDELNCYDSSNKLILIARIGIACTLCFTFPLYSHAIRQNISYIFWKVPTPPITTVLICLIVAVLVENMEIVLGIAGALGAAMLIMTVPGLMYYRSLKSQYPGTWTCGMIFGLFYVVLGSIIAILGVVTTITSYLHIT